MGLLDDAIREHLDLKRRRGADPTEVERQEREVLGPVRPRGEHAVAEQPLSHEDDLEHAPLPYDDEPWEDDRGEPAHPAGAFDYDEEYEDAGAPRGAGTHDGYYSSEREPEPELPRAGYLQSEPDPYRADPGSGSGGGYHQSEPNAPDPYPADPGYGPSGGYEGVGGHEGSGGYGGAGRPVHGYANDPADPSHGYGSANDGDPFSAHYVPEPDRSRPNTDEPTAEFSIEELRAAEHDPYAPDDQRASPGDGTEDVLEETPDFLQETPDHDRLWFEQRPPRDFDFDG